MVCNKEVSMQSINPQHASLVIVESMILVLVVHKCKMRFNFNYPLTHLRTGQAVTLCDKVCNVLKKSQAAKYYILVCLKDIS